MYFDGTPHAGDEYGVCGVGGTDGTAFAYSVVYLQTCNQAANDDTRTIVATHEMTHGMGAVPSQAPHACDSGHVCDSSSDLMKAVLGSSDTLGGLTLDVGRDDYYGHSGSWSDVRRSGLLYDLDQSLAPAPEIVGLTALGHYSAVLLLVLYPTAALTKYVAGIHLPLVAANPYSTTPVNAFGFLSIPATIRFRVGYGIVDAAGTLLKDTVAPNAVARVRATISGSHVVLRWPAVSDPIGLRGYRVSASGLRPLLVTGTSARLPLARVRGKLVSVAAVDRAGNVGAKASVRVRR